MPWLQPYPDRLLDEIAPPDYQPDAAAVARETIELEYLAALRVLPPRSGPRCWNGRLAKTAGGDWRLLPTMANACRPSYLLRPGDTLYRAFTFDVVRVGDGTIAAVTTFGPALFGAFDLPRRSRVTGWQAADGSGRPAGTDTHTTCPATFAAGTCPAV